MSFLSNFFRWTKTCQSGMNSNFKKQTASFNHFIRWLIAKSQPGSRLCAFRPGDFSLSLPVDVGSFTWDITPSTNFTQLSLLLEIVIALVTPRKSLAVVLNHTFFQEVPSAWVLCKLNNCYKYFWYDMFWINKMTLLSFILKCSEDHLI